ncbi:hypothetical protein [Arthrobacter sp. SX1312]|uniref:hypothetical protein n=1 Tax=Arthrobacter sp. SX1312 TaxID=2058896 RepID=UPI000CE36DDC|nr:hypothetical protein [Arthrobacter sp. SX1312]
MTALRRQMLPLLVGAALLLTACGNEALDAGTAGDFQAEVRAIATSAAAGDADGAVVLAQRLKDRVDGARTDGSVTEDRAAVISTRIDALIASLDAGQVPVVTPGEPTEAPAEAPSDTSTQVVPDDVPAPAQPVPTEAQPAPADEPPALPAPAPDPDDGTVPDGTEPEETEPDGTEPEETEPDETDADDDVTGDDAGSDDPSGEDAPGQGARENSGGPAAEKAAQKAAEQQRKAEDKAREAAQRGEKSPPGNGKGNEGG